MIGIEVEKVKYRERRGKQIFLFRILCLDRTPIF